MKQQHYPGYYTAAEVRKRLNISDTVLHRYRSSGELTREIFPGKTYGYYKISDVERLEGKINARLGKEVALLPTTFTRATAQDMPEIAALLETFYNAKISVEKRAAWIRRNAETTFVLRCNGKVVGCAFIMPLTREKILSIFSNQVKPATRPEDILLYESNKPVHLYVRSVGVLQQSVSKKQRKYWALRLLLGLVEAVVGLGARGIIVENIYAQGDTKAGERALKIMGFTQIASATNRKNFVMDIATSGSPLATRYKNALNQWRAQNDEE